MKPSLRALATHVRTPLISFPQRHQPPSSHAPTFHPSAPQEIKDSYSSFASKLLSSVPLAGPAGGKSKGKGFESNLPKADYEGEWELPARFRRSYAPEEGEMEAVETGGASVAPAVNKKAWYIPAEY